MFPVSHRAPGRLNRSEKKGCFMKSIRLIAGLLSVLLTLLLLAACRKDKPSDPPGTDPSDTTASDTSP